MASPIASSSRVLEAALRKSPLQQCRRCLSSSLRPLGSSAPQAARAPRHPQIVPQRRTFKTIEQAKSQYRRGPFSWRAALLFVATCGGLVWYFEHEKDRMQRKRIAEATKGVGRPKVGGAFELVDQDGRPFTSEMMKGRHALVYFGFTRCPDICPEELDKLASMLDILGAKEPTEPKEAKADQQNRLLPVFITCDPARDTPRALKEYLAEFHPRLVGLTGTYDQIKDLCKKYRVYFSTPQNVRPGQDYLVDHSIYFYLMDPEGDFVEALGRQHSPAQMAQIISDHMEDWRKSH